jgi:hypothetical protein
MPTILAQLRLALTKVGSHKTPGCHHSRQRRNELTAASGSEAPIHAVVLADEEEGDGNGDDHDHGAPDEAAEEIAQGGGHGSEAAVNAGDSRQCPVTSYDRALFA